jgi:hypothetical protein
MENTCSMFEIGNVDGYIETSLEENLTRIITDIYKDNFWDISDGKYDIGIIVNTNRENNLKFWTKYFNKYKYDYEGQEGQVYTFITTINKLIRRLNIKLTKEDLD